MWGVFQGVLRPHGDRERCFENRASDFHQQPTGSGNTIQDQNNRIAQAIEFQKQQQEQIQGLEQKNREATAEVSSLRQKFARHDLNHLSLRKPGLIEKIVNKATKEVGDELAQITDPNR